MKNSILIWLTFTMTVFMNTVTGQQTTSISYTNTLEETQGVLLEYEDLLTKNIFFTYGLEVRRFQLPKWEFYTGFDIGYRLYFDNYQPDLRIGFGYTRTYYQIEKLVLDKSHEFLNERALSQTTFIKLRWLSWDFQKRFQLPIRVTSSVGLQFHFLLDGGYGNLNNRWDTTFETGIGYRF